MLHLRLNSPLLASMLAFVWNSRKWFREELAFTRHRDCPCEVLVKSRGAYFHPCCRYLSHNRELESAANISLNVFEMEVSLWNDVTFVILQRNHHFSQICRKLRYEVRVFPSKLFSDFPSTDGLRSASWEPPQDLSRRAFLESFPQFVLQTCASIHSHSIVDPSFQTMLGKKQLMLTLMSSLFSVVNTVISAFVKMPHVYEEEKMPISRYWKNYLVVGPLMLILVTPRLIVISCFFACIRYGNCVAIMMIALSGYAIPYWIYIYANFKGCGKETVKMILVNFATSILGPCIVVDPTTALGRKLYGYLWLLKNTPIEHAIWPTCLNPRSNKQTNTKSFSPILHSPS